MPAQDGVQVECTPHSPCKRPNDEDEADEVWDGAMGDDEAAVALDARGNDSVLMGVRVAGSGQLDGRHLNGRVDARRRGRRGRLNVDGAVDGIAEGRLVGWAEWRVRFWQWVKLWGAGQRDGYTGVDMQTQETWGQLPRLP